MGATTYLGLPILFHHAQPRNLETAAAAIGFGTAVATAPSPRAPSVTLLVAAVSLDITHKLQVCSRVSAGDGSAALLCATHRAEQPVNRNIVSYDPISQAKIGEQSAEVSALRASVCVPRRRPLKRYSATPAPSTGSIVHKAVWVWVCVLCDGIGSSDACSQWCEDVRLAWRRWLASIVCISTSCRSRRIRSTISKVRRAALAATLSGCWRLTSLTAVVARRWQV